MKKNHNRLCACFALMNLYPTAGRAGRSASATCLNRGVTVKCERDAEGIRARQSLKTTSLPPLVHSTGCSEVSLIRPSSVLSLK